jgi:hypothetical protein
MKTMPFLAKALPVIAATSYLVYVLASGQSAEIPAAVTQLLVVLGWLPTVAIAHKLAASK